MTKSLGGQVSSHPRATAFSLMALLFVLVAGLLFGFAWLFNLVQATRLDQARQNLQAQNQPIDEAKLKQQYPTIEIF